MGMHGRQQKKDKLYSISNICGICGLPVAYKKATIDHIIPRSKGGGNGIMNLQLAHWKCNNAKGNNTPNATVRRPPGHELKRSDEL